MHPDFLGSSSDPLCTWLEEDTDPEWGARGTGTGLTAARLSQLDQAASGDGEATKAGSGFKAK